ncbi:Uu.00g021570.m01.CDS01 [Anthostomella pinea]|uniref:Uu.00g021570.m01.CDS01 n=1 Tax=Anthostomella pinea TaxID=933095 RepID=A0AAI8W0W9_9PEZI|nr:Uu.00g021570.m01.CDS01 [Anthostomella pinea]
MSGALEIREGESGFVFYRYHPSLAAAAVFVALFAINTLVHAFQLARYRTWYFIPFVIGGIVEAIGYGGRIMSSNETPDWSGGTYILQTVFILIGPALMAASIYMILGRLIRLVGGEHLSFIPVNWMSKIFVTIDVISILMQIAGGAMLATADTESMYNAGEDIIISALFMQLAAFGVFVAVAGLFYRRIIQQPTAASRSAEFPWQRYLWLLFAGSALILVRSIFRVAEYLSGSSGLLMANEVFLYVFDAQLMVAVTVLFNVYHPSRIIYTPRRKVLQDESEVSSHVEVQPV